MSFPATPLTVTIEAAFGADRGAHPDTWTWTDLTSRWHPAVDLVAFLGRRDQEGGAGDEQEITFALGNDDGQLTPEDPRSQWWPHVDEGLPVRIILAPGLTPELVLVLTGYAAEITPQWPAGSSRQALVAVVVGGIARQLARGRSPLRSPLHQTIVASDPVAYWSLEDAEGATEAASGLPGGPPMTGGSIARAASELIPGSLPTPDLRDSTGAMRGRVQGTFDGLSWTVAWTAVFEGTNLWTPVDISVSGGIYDRYTIVLSDVVEFFGHDDDTGGSTNLGTVSQDLSDGLPHRIALTVRYEPIADNIAQSLFIDGSVVFTSSDTGSQAGTPVDVVVRPRSSGTSATGGHVTAWNTPYYPRLYEELNVLPAQQAFAEELAEDRAERLSLQQQVQFRVDPDTVDRFGRTEASGWGDATTGETWQTTGGSGSDYAVAAGTATIELDTLNSQRGVRTDDVAWADADMAVTVSASDTAAGPGVLDAIQAGVTLRDIDADNRYLVRVVFLPSGAAAVALGVLIGGTVTATALSDPSDDIPYEAGAPIRVRGQVRGNVIRGKIWRPADPEPPAWGARLVTSGITGELTGRAGIGVRALLDADLTNTLPIVVSVLDLVARQLHPSEPMGRQPVDTLPALLRDCVTADRSIISEGHFGYVWRPRGSRYNQTPTLVIDAANRELALPFAPTRDDATVRNEWTISRPGGSSVTVADQADQARRGRRDDSDEPNIASDQRLADHARWRLGESSSAGLRHPQLGTMLHVAPQLLAAVLSTRPGDRIQAVGLPAQYPGGLDQVVEGVAHTVRGRRWWRWDVVVAPAAPWTVGVWAGDTETPQPAEPKRYAPYDSRVVTAFDAGDDTTLVVEDQTGGGDLWSTTADTPFDIKVRGVRLRVTAVSAATGAQQSLTVQQTPVNGVVGVTAAVGEPVQLWAPARYAL
jgi:hypothetical protein